MIGEPQIEENQPAAAGTPAPEAMPVPMSTSLDEIPPVIPIRAAQKPKKRKGNSFRSVLLWLLIFIMAAVGAVLYFDPGLPRQAWASLSPWIMQVAAVPSTTPTPTSTSSRTPTPTEVLATQTFQPSLTYTARPTATRSPTPMPTSTMTPTSTPEEPPTPTPAPTFVGGGLGQIAFASDREDNARLYRSSRIVSFSGGFHGRTLMEWR